MLISPRFIHLRSGVGRRGLYPRGRITGIEKRFETSYSRANQKTFCTSKCHNKSITGGGGGGVKNGGRGGGRPRHLNMEKWENKYVRRKKEEKKEEEEKVGNVRTRMRYSESRWSV